MDITHITLTNDYHNTSINLLAADNRLSVHQVRRARAHLCGSQGCVCGDFLGTRGEGSHDGFAITDNHDGTATIDQCITIDSQFIGSNLNQGDEILIVAIYNEHCLSAGRQCHDEGMIERESNDITIYKGSFEDLNTLSILIEGNAPLGAAGSYQRKVGNALLSAIS